LHRIAFWSAAPPTAIATSPRTTLVTGILAAKTGDSAEPVGSTGPSDGEAGVTGSGLGIGALAPVNALPWALPWPSDA
jgi:hypothetical protein